MINKKRASVDDDDDDDDGAEEPQRKKPRISAPQNSSNDSEFAFPSSTLEDLALPTKWEPLERTPNTKHAIAIHCVECRQFGVVAPASACCREEYPCQERTRQVTVQGRAATIGGIFVRRKCSTRDCLHGVSCEACSRARNHPMFDRDNIPPTEDGPGLQIFAHDVARCLTCNLRFCSECAWQSTVCHHW